jgi:hypothetical protein
MGTICGPSLANMYLYILEIKWYTIHRPLIYLHFIDDIFLVSKEPIDLDDFLKNFIYLGLNVTTNDIINFLDLYIKYDNLTNK